MKHILQTKKLQKSLRRALCLGGARTHTRRISHTRARNTMVQISRIFLRRVPSITFPVRMIDGVRVTGVVVASTSTSSGKNVDGISTKKASSSSSFSKAPPVVVSEEECEIVNVSVSLMIVVVVSSRSSFSLSFCSRASSSSSPGKIPLRSTRSYSSPSLSLSLSHENAHEFILSLFVAPTDGRIPARFGREPRRQRAVYVFQTTTVILLTNPTP